MDLNYVALIATVVALLLVMVQRTELTNRRLAIGFVVLCLLVIRHNAFLKGDLHDETLVAFVIGFLVSSLIWLLIGRYNPVRSSDDIQVMGMDD